VVKVKKGPREKTRDGAGGGKKRSLREKVKIVVVLTGLS